MHETGCFPSKLFEKWATTYSGCDGGDIGSLNNRSIWFCGIEWGGGDEANVEALNTMFSKDMSIPPSGYDDWKNNLSWIFNWQAVKLLAAIDGRQISDYKLFAEEVKPFTVGSGGYFKMNIYPLAFRNILRMRIGHQSFPKQLASAIKEPISSGSRIEGFLSLGLGSRSTRLKLSSAPVLLT